MYSLSLSHRRRFEPGLGGEDNNATVVQSNSLRSRSKEDSFTEMIDRALEKEFTENDEQSQATDPGSFNNSVAEQQVLSAL